MFFRVGSVGGSPTLLQGLCSTGKNSKKIFFAPLLYWIILEILRRFCKSTNRCSRFGARTQRERYGSVKKMRFLLNRWRQYATSVINTFTRRMNSTILPIMVKPVNGGYLEGILSNLNIISIIITPSTKYQVKFMFYWEQLRDYFFTAAGTAKFRSCLRIHKEEIYNTPTLPNEKTFSTFFRVWFKDVKLKENLKG